MADYKRIQYEDDIVIVYGSDGKIIYKGMEDYEPYKRELWAWDDSKQCYTYNGMTKYCIS